MTDHTETTAPERIWACPDKVENWRWPFASRFPVQHNAPMFEYTLSSTVAASIADAERRGREAAFEQAAAKCQASVDHRVSQIGKNVEDYRQRERWIAGRVQAEICRDAILALRTSPAEPSDTVATVTVTVQEAVIDEAVTRTYRHFKEWSKRGFTADDVTWCEVRADIVDICRALTGASK